MKRGLPESACSAGVGWLADDLGTFATRVWPLDSAWQSQHIYAAAGDGQHLRTGHGTGTHMGVEDGVSYRAQDLAGRAKVSIGDAIHSGQLQFKGVKGWVAAKAKPPGGHLEEAGWDATANRVGDS